MRNRNRGLSFREATAVDHISSIAREITVEIAAPKIPSSGSPSQP